jgi:cell division protein FtsB
MRKLIQKRHILRQNLLAVIGISLSFYFCFHLLAGDRGYFRLMSLENQMTQVSQEYASVTQARDKLESKVVMMRPGTINKDLLEERIRSVLGYRYENEIVLLQSRS